MQREQEDVKQSAIAHRVSGAEQKDFDKFMRSVDDTIQKTKKQHQAPKKKRTDDAAFQKFFGNIARIPDAGKAQRAMDKARREGRSPHAMKPTDLDDRMTVPIRVHKGRPNLPD